MDAERFGRLAQAWGGDLRRWPSDAQADAARLALEPEAAALLAWESDLDLMLAEAPAIVPGAALRERILASAPRHRPRALVGWILRFGVGAGLASACAAGVAMGLMTVGTVNEPSALAISTLASPVEATAFGPAPEAAPEAQES